MIKRFLRCFSVVLAFSAPVARVYAEPTVDEYILHSVSNALYQYKDGEYVPVLLPYDEFGSESFQELTIWQILFNLLQTSYQINGEGYLDSWELWDLLEKFGYGEYSYDYLQFEFYDGKSMSDALQDGAFMRELVNKISERQLGYLMFPDQSIYGLGNIIPLLSSAISASSGGGGGGGEFPTIDIKNILENSITNNVAVSNILDVLINPNSRQTNVLNISLTNISHYASNTVDIATQIRDILKEILENQTNHNDGIDTSINWMTNNWPDSTAAPPIGGGDSSNDLWSVWVPTAGGGTSELHHYFVPNIHWDRVGEFMGVDYYAPSYDSPESQPDTWQDNWYNELMGLLQDYEVGGIDGQKFVAGLLFLQSRMMGKLSTQLYMLHNKIPTKTNLWDSINEETNWVRENAESLKTEVESKQYDVESLFNNADTSMFSTYFPKIQSSISKLNTTSNDPVLRFPLPSVFSSGSGSDVWIVDVREISGYDKFRDFVRWVCIIVWSIIFVRTFIVPSLVILCLCARFADMACGLLFTDNTDGCHILGDVIGSCSDFVLNLIGLDTKVKRWAVGS